MRTLLLAIALVLAVTAGYAAEPSPGPPDEDRPLPIPNAGEIIGLKIINRDGQDLGEVDDLVVGSDGRIDYLVIRRGGFLGLWRKRVAVPWAASSPHVQENLLILDLSEDRLNGAPAFNDWDAFRRGDYPERVRAYFGVGTNGDQMRSVEGSSGPPPPGAAPPSGPQSTPMPER